MNSLKSENVFDFSNNERHKPNVSPRTSKITEKIRKDWCILSNELQNQENFKKPVVLSSVLEEASKIPEITTHNSSDQFTSPNDSVTFSESYLSPLNSDLHQVSSMKDQFNNTLNMSSHQRLLEIEEKRK